jgi:hypothetical protein
MSEREQAEIHDDSLNLCKAFVYGMPAKLRHETLQNPEVESPDVEVMETCNVSERVSF